MADLVCGGESTTALGGACDRVMGMVKRWQFLVVDVEKKIVLELSRRRVYFGVKFGVKRRRYKIKSLWVQNRTTPFLGVKS